MIKEIEIGISPSIGNQQDKINLIAAGKLGISVNQINDIKVIRKSVDARGKNIKLILKLRVAWGDDAKVGITPQMKEYHRLSPDTPDFVIVGAGPAGLFAALRCIEQGIRPIVLERGCDVDKRRVDLALISREKRINPESNYCYGEGGAGAFSDGKLFTRSKKRGNNREVLETLVQFGAKEDILMESHPHIGSDRLPSIIRSIREKIIECGGEVRFNTKAEELIIEDKKVKGVRTSAGEEFIGPVLLATGHSARDFIRNIHRQGVKMETKGIAVGVRLEHPQKRIDEIQYHQRTGRGEYLPAAEYSFVTQVENRGVYSFCMCPGGVIVPAGSGSQELVVNGMSASARAGKLANSGMVVEVRPGDFPEYASSGGLELMDFQEDIEKKIYSLSGNSIVAPAQRMDDFISGHISESLPETSYAPGIKSADFNMLLPPFITERLKKGFLEFDRKRKGFLSHDAILVGLESRTSSPIRIPRNKETYEHIELENLYPVGEGAGYAGGIVSAAIDGINAVDAHKRKILE